MAIHASSGLDGTELWGIASAEFQAAPAPACGDLDGDGWSEVVMGTQDGVRVYDAGGTELLVARGCTNGLDFEAANVALADMDGDGSPEILMGRCIFEADGTLRGKGAHGFGSVPDFTGSMSFAADLDGDGAQELIAGNAAYDIDGGTLWFNGLSDGYVGALQADDDADGEVAVTGDGRLRIQDSDGDVLCEVDLPGGDGRFGGAPTTADFDGDGLAEVAVGTSTWVTVFTRECVERWRSPITDASSGICASAAYDLDGDGASELIYEDEVALRIISGLDGAELYTDGTHENGTAEEGPAVADVDGDGHVEILEPNFSFSGGNDALRVWTNPSWATGPRLWNQHAWSVTNIDADGSFPTSAPAPWLDPGTFRGGVGDAVGASPIGDLRPVLADLCALACADGELTVWVQLENAGAVDVTTPVGLDFVVSDGTTAMSLGSVTWTGAVPSGKRSAAEVYTLTGVPPGTTSLEVHVDGGGALDECHEDDNVAIVGVDGC
jgi:hypothetical protein